MRRLVLFVLLSALAVGCRQEWPGDFQLDGGFVEPSTDSGLIDAGIEGGPDIGFPYTFNGQVRSILEAKCHRCHGIPTANFAPRELFTYIDLTQIDPDTNQPVHELVAARIVSDVLRMPPPSSGLFLSATEIAIITTWSQTGAPE